MKKILFKLGFFLFEMGAMILINLLMGKENRKRLEVLVAQLADEDLTAKQKYNRAKKFINEVKGDIPEVAKNIAIEAAVSKVTKKGQSMLENLR